MKVNLTKRKRVARKSKRISEAIDVLDSNWKDGYTVPSPYLYPFQWLWDSGFIALGLSHYDEERAWSEIEYLFKGQWENGLIPHIIFHKESDLYFPGPDIWQAHHQSHALDIPKTSGIVQPPVIGFILEEMYKSATDKKAAREKLLEWIPKLYRFHSYLYKERDPNNEGLVYIRHNWESGLDNSPMWDEALNAIEIEDKDLSSIRKDLANIDASNRPTNSEYQRYLWLVDHFKKNNYIEYEIQKECPFLIQDPVTNALLIKSNYALFRLSVELGDPIDEFEFWAESGKKAMNSKLWSSEYSNYLGYNLVSDTLIEESVNTSFMAALYAQIPSKSQAQEIVHAHLIPFDLENFYLMPSTPYYSKKFDPKRYWRGPVWVNMNWMFMQGLQSYEYEFWADQVRQDTFELIEQFGIYEYYHPKKSETEGCGSSHFSWTAALFLDLLHRTE